MTTDTANVLDGEGWRDGLEAGVRRRIPRWGGRAMGGRASPSACRWRPANR
jgi:hypothetical protein